MKGLLLLLFFFTFILCQQEPIEGFFSQSGHTNNWAVLVKKKNPPQKNILITNIFTGMHLPLLVQLSTCCQHTFNLSYS